MWIEEDLYRRLREVAAMPAVDLLPVLVADGAARAGLILRDDAEGGEGWNLIGGGIRRGESIAEAAERHVAETLGPGFRWRRREFERADTVGEYFPERREGYPHDVRKHSIALSYAILAEAEAAEPQGEALDFRWFPLDAELPSPIGFGQEPVIRRLLPFARELAGSARHA